MSWVVGPVDHDEVVRLRMAVLRPGQPYDASRYVGEELGFSVGAREDGRLVGCATFFPQAFPGPGEEDGPPDAVVPEEAEGPRGLAAARHGDGAGAALDRRRLGCARARGWPPSARPAEASSGATRARRRWSSTAGTGSRPSARSSRPAEP